MSESRKFLSFLSHHACEYLLPIPVANANGVKAFSEYGISKILETLTLGKNRMDVCMNHENFYHLN